MWRATRRSLLQHKLRLVLSGVAIVLGVGFVVGTFIFTDTLNKTFTDLFSQTTTDVVVTPDAEVSGDGFAGGTATLPQSLLPKVEAVDGVAKAAGSIFADGVTIIDPTGEPVGQAGPPQFGTNWEGDPDLTAFRLESGRGPTRAGEVAIDSISAEKSGYHVGDEVHLVAPSGDVTAKLVGTFRFGTSGNLAGATITAFDTRTAQQVILGGKRAFTEIDAKAVDGVSQQQLADQVSAVVGPGVKVQTGEEAADQAASDITSALSFINTFLLVFAGVALFVGTFIILNTFSMLVAQRTREMALLRAVGATRRQVNRSVLFESFVVGLLGSLLGLLMGVGVAVGLQALFKAIGADIPTNGLAIEPRTIVVGILVGVIVTVLAAYGPARRASKIPPVAALRDDFTLPTRSLRTRAIAGTTMAAVGVLLLIVGVSQGNKTGSQFVGLGTVITLIGVIIASPVIAGPVVRVLGAAYPKLFGTVGRLAVENAERQPRRTAATASALMIGLALVSALTIFAASASASINQVIDQVIGAEFLLSNSAQRPFPTTVAKQVSGVDGVSVVSPSKNIAAKIGDQTTLVTSVDPSTVSDVVTLDFTQGSIEDLHNDAIAVDRQTATDLGLKVGDPVHVTWPTGSHTYTLTATYEAAGFFAGWVVTNDALKEAGIDIGDAFVYIKTSDGADLTAVRASIDSILQNYPTVQVQSQAEFKDTITTQVNQVLLVMVMLLSLAILIAVLGIVNTLVLSVIERTREIGLLRAVGALRKQIRRMVILESVVIAIYGALIGMVLGVVFAVALQRTLVDALGVLSIPWGFMVGFLILAGVVGVLAALWPAFRAGRLDVLRAVTTD